ncbi:actin family [Cladochytrium replicatum]|nr:actin family [Cladochytrium replicatum]
MAATYGGDEVAALVFDIGSSSTRIGYAGEDSPRAVFPSYVGYNTVVDVNVDASISSGPTLMDVDSTSASSSAPAKKQRKGFVGETEIYRWRPNFELKSPYSHGNIDDFDVYSDILDYSFNARLRLQSSEHPVLLAEPSWNTKEIREKLAEIMFEQHTVPALYLARSAVLSAFASGKSTALVLDSGGGMTSAVPVFDGYVLKKGIQKQEIGGDFLSAQALAMLREMGIDVVPQYLVARKDPVDSGKPASFVLKNVENTHQSFHSLAVKRVMAELKETICVCARSANESAPVQKSFEFPNGFNTYFNAERSRISEIMFDLNKAFKGPATTVDLQSSLPIQRLVIQSINSCDPDARPTLYNNVVLTGGNTLFPEFTNRLHSELLKITAGKIKFHAAGGANERRFGPWIGGSILASLGTFHQLWISKEEYAEVGGGIVEKRLH